MSQWIDNNTIQLENSLDELIADPHGTCFNEQAWQAVQSLVLYTTQHGTTEQIQKLYFLLVNARSEMNRQGHETNRVKLAECTRFMLHHRPEEAHEVNRGILSTRLTMASPAA